MCGIPVAKIIREELLYGMKDLQKVNITNILNLNENSSTYLLHLKIQSNNYHADLTTAR